MSTVVVMTIDRRQPGEDVTGVYTPDVEQRLIDEGYLQVEESTGARQSSEEAVKIDGQSD